MEEKQQTNNSQTRGNSTRELYSAPWVRNPTTAQLADVAKNLGFHLEDEELKAFHTMIKGNIDVINSIESLVEPQLPTRYPRLPGYRPDSTENPYNAWYWKCEIHGATSGGKLAGKRVAIKDNIAVAGVPMMYGCHALEGYTPNFDATVITKILDAGGIINGKTVCENLISSGGSSSAAKGPVLNPHDTTRTSGGSSSGSAVVVQVGDADMAIGSDQGGSVRLPSSWTGIVGIKPTHGLVPYTGALGMDAAIDHLGPMARTVKDCALLLEVIAGYDGGMDPRQQPNITVPEYTKELENSDVNGLKIGILEEGFTAPNADQRVNTLLKDVINRLADVGVGIEDTSIPLHTQGGAIWQCTEEGNHENMFRLGGNGTGHTGYYPTSFAIALGKMFTSRPDDLPDTMKLVMLQSEYLKQNYMSQVYCRGRNLVFPLRQSYDDALKTVDVLALPTIPFTATKLLQKGTTMQEYFKNCLEMAHNSIGFNLTGHPVLSVNAGFIDGLPVGLTLVGRHYDELTVFKVAQAIENVRDSAN
nr:amidase-like [Lytechinus pictus]